MTWAPMCAELMQTLSMPSTILMLISVWEEIPNFSHGMLCGKKLKTHQTERFWFYIKTERISSKHASLAAERIKGDVNAGDDMPR